MLQISQDMLLWAAAALLTVFLIFLMTLRKLLNKINKLIEQHQTCQIANNKQERLIDALENTLTLLTERRSRE